MKNKTGITLLVLMALVLEGILFPNTAKAEETVIKTYTGSVNGIERTFTITDIGHGTNQIYVKIGDMDSFGIWNGNLDGGPGRYGEVWILDKDYKIIYWLSHDLTPIPETDTLYTVPNPDSTDFIDYVHDVNSLIFEGSGSQGIVVGYKTLSGEEYPLPSFDEMKAIAAPGSSVPEPHYIPKADTSETEMPAPPTPSSPGVTDSSTSKPSPTAVATVEPSIPEPGVPGSNTPTLAPDMSGIETSAPASDTPDSKKVSIKPKKKAKALYEGDEFIGQYTLKKGVLTWKGPKKKGKEKGVKQAGFNKKTKKLAFVTKKGDGYVLSFKTGKKKRIVKKKGKKLIYSGKFVTKIKTTSGKINISNK